MSFCTAPGSGSASGSTELAEVLALPFGSASLARNSQRAPIFKKPLMPQRVASAITTALASNISRK
jgi:hypothetical protein